MFNCTQRRHPAPAVSCVEITIPVAGVSVAHVKLDIEQVPIGACCAADILDDQGRVLVGKGETLTQEVVDGLRSRGVTSLNLSESDLALLTGKKHSRSTEARSATIPSTRVRVDRSGEAYSSERKEKFAQTLSGTLSLIESLASQLDDPSTENLTQLAQVPHAFQEMLFEDSDQSISTSVDSPKDSLGARSVHFALLAMAVGIEQQLPEDDIILLGKAGLLHDLGLYRLPAHFRDPSRTLNYEEAAQFRKHPEISAELLGDFPFISDELRVLIQQVHELPDGGGYPRGLKAHRFHRLTCILSLAELYVALTHRGSGRPPLAPYDVIRYLLFRCRDGQVDSAALRALINQFTLYGIGSPVHISDGAQALVLRRDANHFDLPVVEIDRDGEPEMVRLSQTKLTISGPHRSSQQMHLDRSLAENVSLGDLLFL